MPACPKSRPRALDKQDRVTRKQSVEDRENAKVRVRSHGQCEVLERVKHTIPEAKHMIEGGVVYALHHCRRQARHIHHLLGGSGRRGMGESALAVNKLHLCPQDHDLITRHILQPEWTDVENRAGTVTFRRER